MNRVTNESECIEEVSEEENNPKTNDYVVNIIRKKDIVSRSAVLKMA